MVPAGSLPSTFDPRLLRAFGKKGTGSESSRCQSPFFPNALSVIPLPVEFHHKWQNRTARGQVGTKGLHGLYNGSLIGKTYFSGKGLIWPCKAP